LAAERHRADGGEFVVAPDWVKYARNRYTLHAYHLLEVGGEACCHTPRPCLLGEEVSLLIGQQVVYGVVFRAVVFALFHHDGNGGFESATAVLR